MATTKKATTTVSTKKAAPKKATTKQKPAKPKEDLVVFAIRLTQAERDKIHATAGPRNATHFVRTVTAAFANEDVKAFQAVLKEAKELRG
ncbi:MAG: hypothetical protein IH848_01360 [Acidobacteria bacterium]|nr:hypothetical protein [Acidobacteriota bacterium]